MLFTNRAFLISVAITLSLLTAHSRPLPFQDAGNQGIVSGRVQERTSKRPLAGATIVVQGTSLGAVSKADGTFNIQNVPVGIRSLKASAIGYEASIVSDIAVSPVRSAFVEFELSSSFIESKEVVVTAAAFSKDPSSITSTQTLSSEEVRRAPGVQEDVVRAIALMPGVAVTQAGRNDLAVRGGAPFENLFVVDNIEVPNINHFGTQGSSGGPLSLINIDFVQDVSLSTGGFGPRFGDRLSSATNIRLREGNESQFGGEFNLSATGVGAIAEGPLGSSGNYLLSLRRSYLDFIFTLAGFGFVPEYYDLTFKATQRLDSRNKLSFLLIGATGTVRFNNDNEDKRFSNSRVVAPSQQQYFSGFTWSHSFDAGLLSVTLGRTFTTYSTSQQDSLGAPVFRANSNEGESSLRADYSGTLGKKIEINAGIISKYASLLSYDILLPGFARLNSQGMPSGLLVDTSFTGFRMGSYGHVIWYPTSSTTVTAGLRHDLYGFLDIMHHLSPRLAASVRLSDALTVSISGGRYVQSPQFIWLVGDPSTEASSKPMIAYHVVSAVEWIPRQDLKVQFELYTKNYTQYPTRTFRPTAVLAPAGFDDITTDIPFGLEPIDMSATGRAMGVELLIQKRLSDLPLYGLLSLSVNRTEFSTAEDGVFRAGAFDTPIILTTTIGWRPNDLWEISGKVRGSDGLPITPFITSLEESTTTGFPIGSLDFRQYNSGGRLPYFFALDFRVDRRWFFDTWQLIAYIDIQNVTGRKNVNRIRWNPRSQSIEEQRSIGVLPSIGVNIEF